MTRYLVMTRGTVIRHRYVEADNEKEAEAKSVDAAIEHEEDENEETLSITAVASTHRGG